MKRAILTGAAVGLATSLWMFAEFAVGFHDGQASVGRWSGFLSLIFPMLGAYSLVTKSPRRGWGHCVGDGVIFGLVWGAVSGAAIYLYFSRVNPGFTSGGRSVDAGEQALAGLVSSLVLALILVVVIYAVVGRKRSHS
jgi:hypothetical protein